MHDRSFDNGVDADRGRRRFGAFLCIG
jgi:hypothetical protein